MSDNTQQTPKPETETYGDGERTKQVTVVGWLAGVFAVAAGITLINAPTWPAAFGIAAVAAMVTVICCYIVKK